MLTGNKILDESPKRTASIAFKSYHRIMDEWRVSHEDRAKILCLPSHTELGEQNLSSEVLERISFVLKIYKQLRILLHKREQANEWISTPNSAFGGLSAIEIIISNADQGLLEVANYLNNQIRGLSSSEQRAYILNSVLEWTGSEEQAIHWYKTTLIPPLNMTAEFAVENGYFDAVFQYIASIRLSGFA